LEGKFCIFLAPYLRHLNSHVPWSSLVSIICYFGHPVYSLLSHIFKPLRHAQKAFEFPGFDCTPYLHVSHLPLLLQWPFHGMFLFSTEHGPAITQNPSNRTRMSTKSLSFSLLPLGVNLMFHLALHQGI
jgi:hypothetical protein